jgi:hypothetical protein
MVHLSLAPFGPVGAGYGCHRDWLKSAEAGPRSCAEVAGRHGTAGYRRRLEPENQLHNDGLPGGAQDGDRDWQDRCDSHDHRVAGGPVPAGAQVGLLRPAPGVAVWTRRDTRARVVIKRLLQGGE